MMSKPASLTCLTATICISWQAGCGGVPVLPDTFEVATSATEKSEAEKGTGPIGLANSTWSLTRVADPADGGSTTEVNSISSGQYGGLLSGGALARPPVGEQIFLAEFGPQGQMLRVTENRFLVPSVYGSEIPIGDQWQGATIPGVAYNSASYGLEVGGRFGLAIVVHVRFGNFLLGRATLYSWGVQTGDALTGAFGYFLNFTDGIVRGLGTIADQYPVTGRRVG